MSARVCIVVSSPMTLRAFLAPHVAALRLKFEVTVVANFIDAGPRYSDAGIETVSVPIERRIAPLRDLIALARLTWLFRRSRCAAVLSVTPKAGLLTMLASVLAGVQVRIHFFTGQVWATRRGTVRWFLKSFDRVIARCATHVLVDSPSQRDFLIAEGVVSAGRSRVLGKGSICGVDASRFKPDAQARGSVRARLGFPEDGVVFLYLGRLNRDKGVLDLAAAFSRIAATDRKLRLLVVGPDEDGMQSEMQAALGGAMPQARFVNYTDRPEQYMATADAFCLPSYREGFGTTIIEAAACAVPAIGSRVYGITDAIDEDATGLLFEPGDTEALAECMGRIAHDPAMRLAMGERAREKAVRDFSAATITGELLKLCEAAIS